MVKNIAIIKCGNTLSEIKDRYGDFNDWLIKKINNPEAKYKLFDLAKGDTLRHPQDFSCAFIVGYPENLRKKYSWEKTLIDWIITASYCNIPVLAIGYGFKTVVKAFGGEIITDFKSLYPQKISVNIFEAPACEKIFTGIGDNFESYSICQSINTIIPGNPEVIAKSLGGETLGVKVNSVFALQFHPEISEEVIRMYIKALKLPTSELLRVRLRSEYKNQSIISNFMGCVLK